MAKYRLELKLRPLNGVSGKTMTLAGETDDVFLLEDVEIHLRYIATYGDRGATGFPEMKMYKDGRKLSSAEFSHDYSLAAKTRRKA